MHHCVYEKCDMPKKKWYEEKEACPDRVKGYNLCKKRNELRCFKQCQPISQPCSDATAPEYFNYFTSRTNFEFSGLVVVSNTGNPTSGCSMLVRVTDRVGTNTVAEVNPGASIPIFVEGLIALEIACVEGDVVLPVPATCSGEIIFDLEYCATRTCL
ncbi:hypothetical protein LCL96_14595 [Rossellomorea aquimaris]|uniref:S-Ena type endospore appendage n=1 Tax=Rossellomorea aquimaris TaxID=189382 RepID=UPI001CD2042E|nr:S-Ena type endospore appendage [Rossellomorea aquimaris]MCA1060164.1 hypothetical protein [Rossellomorea aquimaris]